MSIFRENFCREKGAKKSDPWPFGTGLFRPADCLTFVPAGPARGQPFRAKKISPVIGRNLQANRGFPEIVTGDNRRPSATLREYNARRALTREDADAIARCRTRLRANPTRAAAEDRRVFHPVSVPTRLSSKRALLRGKTPNMATQTPARNCGKRRFEKVFEQISNLCRKFPANIFARQMVRMGAIFFEQFSARWSSCAAAFFITSLPFRERGRGCACASEGEWVRVQGKSFENSTLHLHPLTLTVSPDGREGKRRRIILFFDRAVIPDTR